MSVDFILILIALLCFAAAAFGISARNINLTALGLAFVTLSFLLS